MRIISMRDSLFLFPLSVLFFIALVLWSVGLVLHVPLWMFGIAVIAQCCVFGLFFISHIASLRSLLQNQMHRIIMCVLALVLMSHAIGVLLPEVGFDALWYHLPITRSFVETGTIHLIPSLYQSSQPILGNILFAPWYALGGSAAVKVSCFLIMILYLVGVAHLARKFLSTHHTLLVVLLVATFHTIAWQASSAYVDIFTGCFGIAALLVLFREQRHSADDAMIGFFVAGMLLTKAVALLFLPPYVLLLFLQRRRVWMSVGICGVLFASQQLGGYVMSHALPVVSIFSMTSNDLIVKNGGVQSLLQFAVERSAYIATLPLQLTFHRESYLSILFLVAIPFLLTRMREGGVLSPHMKQACIFVLLSLCVWSCVVPISVRYGLVPITLCAILLTRVLVGSYWGRRVFVAVVLFTVMTNMTIRMIVHSRALPYLVDSETSEEYLRKYDQGILKGPLESWYPNLRD